MVLVSPGVALLIAGAILTIATVLSLSLHLFALFNRSLVSGWLCCCLHKLVYCIFFIACGHATAQVVAFVTRDAHECGG